MNYKYKQKLSSEIVYISDNKVFYKIDDVIRWEISVTKLVFIGEYTTSAGPWADDWFVVFGLDIDEWWQASCYAIDEDFWKSISECLQCEILPTLSWSTNWLTNILYPTTLNGKELFTIQKTETQSQTFWQKIFNFKNKGETIELTPAVKSLFGDIA